MSSISIGLFGIGALLLMFLLRMPIAFAMAFVGFLGYAYLVSPAAAVNILIRDIFTEFSSYPLSVIPAFVLMGTYAFASGMSADLYRAAYIWLGWLRGGLILATIAACSAFGAICGSCTATTAAMGKIALPEMRKYRYDDALSTGSLASAATLALLIPPSTILIVYGILTEQSIGKLFIAGLIPGIILTLLMLVTTCIICLVWPSAAPASSTVTSFKDKVKSLAGVAEALLLFGLALGGLFAGLFTPTQAGSIGAAGALLIGLIKRQLNWQRFIEANKEGVRISCMVLFLITGAVIFGHFMAVSRIPEVLINYIGHLAISPIAIMALLILFYFIAGCFIDAMALVVLTVPIVYPIVIELGFDPIWFGVMIVMASSLGVITPPVGVDVYVVKGIVPDVPLETIFKGIFPFLVPMIILIILLIGFPQLATFLPRFITW